jgi:hypothetical protein
MRSCGTARASGKGELPANAHKKIPPKRDLKEGPESPQKEKQMDNVHLAGSQSRLHTYRNLVYTDSQAAGKPSAISGTQPAP